MQKSSQLAAPNNMLRKFLMYDNFCILQKKTELFSGFADGRNKPPG
jgi:hypothetical protein